MKNYGEEVTKHKIFYYLSDLDYDTPKALLSQDWILNKKPVVCKGKAGGSLDMIDMKRRMKLTEAEVSKILNEWKALPKSLKWFSKKREKFQWKT